MPERTPAYKRQVQAAMKPSGSVVCLEDIAIGRPMQIAASLFVDVVQICICIVYVALSLDRSMYGIWSSV
jgi:hypothetical protein